MCVKEGTWDKWSQPQAGGSHQSVFVLRTDIRLFWWDQAFTLAAHTHTHTLMVSSGYSGPLCVQQWSWCSSINRGSPLPFSCLTFTSAGRETSGHIYSKHTHTPVSESVIFMSGINNVPKTQNVQNLNCGATIKYDRSKLQNCININEDDINSSKLYSELQSVPTATQKACLELIYSESQNLHQLFSLFQLHCLFGLFF